MSIQNDLIRRARMRPAELTINLTQVGSLAEACRSASHWSAQPGLDLEAQILGGKLRFMDIPVRVLGAPTAA
jgi:hypothetical protein